jgi:apolipoprotein N-acyltransferase
MGFRNVDRLSWLCLTAGAILLFFSLLQPSLPVAAWLAPVFLLRFTRTQRSWIGLPTLALVMCIVMYSKWSIGFAPVSMLGISGAIAALLTLVGYVADRWLTPRLAGFAATLVFPLAITSVDWLGSMLAAPLSSYLLPSLFSLGATWNSPAYTQADNLPLMQIVSLTGMWGLTFLISWFASVVNALWEQIQVGEVFDWRPVRNSVIGFSAVMLAVLLFGSARLAFFPPTAQTVRVAGIVSREDLFATITDLNPQELMPGTGAQRDAARTRFTPIVDDLFARSQQEADNGAKIIVWGETAAPVLEEDTIAVIEQASTLARSAQIYLQIALVVFNNTDHFPFLQNRAIMLDPAGTVVWDYHKAYPTPGENAMVVAGPPIVPFVDTPYGRLATVICFDADFPALVRQAGQAGVDILLLPYKDWASVRIQHAQMATFRAIENGMSLVRPVLSGLSTAVDPQGRMLAQVDAFATSSPTLVTMVATQGRATLYARIGDNFAYLCVAGLLWLMGLVILQRGVAKPSLMIEEPVGV